MAVTIAIDTNVYVELARGAGELADALARADTLGFPFPVLAELRAGFAAGSRSAGNERVLRSFLDRPHVAILWPTELTTRIYADLFAYLRQRGTPVPTNDLWIASVCVERGFALATRDRHFDLLPQLPRAGI